MPPDMEILPLSVRGLPFTKMSLPASAKLLAMLARPAGGCSVPPLMLKFPEVRAAVLARFRRPATTAVGPV